MIWIGKSSHRIGYNILYTDGSASWYTDLDESIWKRRVFWDYESDEFTYDSLYGPNPYNSANDDNEGRFNDIYQQKMLDIFRVWNAFCYNLRDPF